MGPQKNFSILSFEMLNFYAFWTLEQRNSTATVIKIFMTAAHQCRRPIYRLLLPIFYYCIIMLSNVASTPLSCDRLLASLFSVHCSQLHKDVGWLWSDITTEQSAVTLNMYRVLAILNFSHWQFLTNFEVKIFMCIVHLMCDFIISGFLAVS